MAVKESTAFWKTVGSESPIRSQRMSTKDALTAVGTELLAGDGRKEEWGKDNKQLSGMEEKWRPMASATKARA